jgi:hypothetical protein
MLAAEQILPNVSEAVTRCCAGQHMTPATGHDSATELRRAGHAVAEGGEPSASAACRARTTTEAQRPGRLEHSGSTGGIFAQ